MTLYGSIGAAVAGARSLAGLTQDEAAARYGCNRARWSAMEGGAVTAPTAIRAIRAALPGADVVITEQHYTDSNNIGTRCRVIIANHNTSAAKGAAKREQR